jgi:hypothetical protein
MFASLGILYRHCMTNNVWYKPEKQCKTLVSLTGSIICFLFKHIPYAMHDILQCMHAQHAHVICRLFDFLIYLYAIDNSNL